MDHAKVLPQNTNKRLIEIYQELVNIFYESIFFGKNDFLEFKDLLFSVID